MVYPYRMRIEKIVDRYALYFNRAELPQILQELNGSVPGTEAGHLAVMLGHLKPADVMAVLFNADTVLSIYQSAPAGTLKNVFESVVPR